MKLVWHLVKSDLRRLRWPLLFWALAIGLNVGCNAYQLTLPPRALWPWKLADALILVTFVTRWGLTIALAAQLVQADPVRGMAAFWPTRPIGGGRMFAAKAASLAVLALAPALADVVAVAGFGFSIRVGLVAFVDFAGTAAVAVAAAAAFASVAETFGSFVLRSIMILFVGSVVATMASGLAAMSRRLGGGAFPTETLMLSSLWAFKVGVVVGGAAFIGWQYRQRHARLGLLIAFLGTSLLLTLPSYWPWDFSGGSGRTSPAAPLVLRSPVLEAARLSQGAAALTGKTECVAEPDGTFLEPVTTSGAVELQWPRGQTQMVPGLPATLLPRASLAEGAPGLLQQVLAPLRLLNSPAKGELALNLALADTSTVTRLAGEPAELQTEVVSWRRRYVVEAELPLADGAAARGTSWKARIAAIHEAGRVTVIEDAYLSWLAGDQAPYSAVRMFGIPATIGLLLPRNIFYVLVNRSRGEAMLAQRAAGPAGPEGLAGQANFGRLFAWRRTLDFPVEATGVPPGDWLRGATLLRIRVEDLGSVVCPLIATGVTAKP